MRDRENLWVREAPVVESVVLSSPSLRAIACIFNQALWTAKDRADYVELFSGRFPELRKRGMLKFPDLK